VDPFAWGRKICSIAEAHDAVYIDMLQAFRQAPQADSMYYPVDGHMNEKGQPVMARAISDSLNANKELLLGLRNLRAHLDR
jgi:hypothetical protein